MSVKTNAVIGKYTDVELVGRGGFASVYKAVDGGQQVAVKVLSGMWSADDLQRFSREQEAMRYLNDIEGVVPLLDVGVSALDAPFIVMPYYRGGSLQNRLETFGALSQQQALAAITSLGEVLLACHKRGVYHRDIKPGNILIDDNGSLWLADFGITQINDGQALVSDATYTPSYCPPEMHRMERDVASGVAIDVYGLAATTWALLAGRAPFSNTDSATDPLVRLMRIASESVGSPGNHVSQSVVSVIETAMSKDPAQRYETIEDFIKQLHSPTPNVARSHKERLLVGSQASTTISNDELTRQVPYEEAAQLFADEAMVQSQSTIVEETQLYPQVEETSEIAGEEQTTKQPLLLAIAAVILLAVAATLLWVLLSGKDAQEAQPDSTDLAEAATSLPGAVADEQVVGASDERKQIKTVARPETTMTQATLAEQLATTSQATVVTTAQPVVVDRLDLTITKWGLARVEGGVKKKIYFSYRCPSSAFDITYTFKLPREDNSCQPGTIVETSVTEPEVDRVGQISFGQVITIAIETRDGLEESQSVVFENPYKIKTGCYVETCEIETME